MSRIVRSWLALGICGVIAGASLMPSKWKVALGISRYYYPLDLVPYPWLARLLGRPVIPVNPHAIAHVLAFGGAAFLLMMLVRALRRRFYLALSLCFLAFWTEQAEHAIYRSDFEWKDLRLDLYSIAAAFALASASKRLLRNRSEKRISSPSMGPEFPVSSV